MTVPAARSRAVGRVAVAVGFALVLIGVVWVATPRGLRPPIDIVGYPTFENYDYHRPFLVYRLLVWVLPLVTLAVWWLLGRAGPFAVEPRPLRAAAVDDARSGTEDDAVHVPWIVWRYGRLVPTAAVVAVVVSGTSGGDPRQQISAVGVLAGLAVAAAVVGAGLFLARVTAGRSGRTGREHAGTALAVVHAYVAATAAVWGLVWHLRHSSVRVLEDDSLVRYPWVPWWGGVVAWLVTVAALVLGARVATPARLERAVVQVVVGSVLIYLVVSQMASQVGPIQGFDDMQSVTGADLLSRGFFPWSDFLFIHGLFEDALRSSAGFLLFGHTLWATNAALGLLWIPLTWLGIYWVGVWASRGRSGPVLAVGLLVVWAAVTIPPSFRWVAMGVVWVLLGQAVRHRRWLWTALLTAVLFVQAVLVPEASFQVIGVVVVLVASDLYHRDEGARRWRSLLRTRVFVLTGVACTVVWGGFLATQGALDDFVSYYLVFGPGHAESGALPVPDLASRKFLAMFLVAVGGAAATMWGVVARMLHRRPLGSPEWVALGVAITTGLYGEKGLGRFDDGHLLQVVTVSLPLFAIWAVLLLIRLDEVSGVLLSGAGSSTPDGQAPGRRAAVVERRSPVRVAMRQAVSAVVVVLLLALPSVHQAAQAAPGRNTTYVSGGRVPGLGWASDDAVDRATLGDLRRILELYTREGPVFDFTNSPGYFYYLLGEDPPTSFFHVSMAIPEFTQEMVIDELEESRPALVVFDAPFGLPGWDGPHNMVRHYTLSQYLLDGWTPLLRNNRVLFMIRNDLLDDAPDPPRLSRRVEVSELWSAGPACDWGNAANFLTSEPTGEQVVLDVPAPEQVRRVSFGGWAYDEEADRSVRLVALAADGEVVATVAATQRRADVADVLGNPKAEASGFAGVERLDRDAGELEFYAVDHDGVAHPLAGSPPRELPDSLAHVDGNQIPVSSVPVSGFVDRVEQEDVEVSIVTVPAGVELPSFRLAELSSRAGDLGTGQLEITASSDVVAGRDQRILAETLPVTGRSLRLRVGSCLQWHGYAGDTLYLTQRHLDHPVDRIVLSDVARPFKD